MSKQEVRVLLRVRVHTENHIWEYEYGEVPPATVPRSGDYLRGPKGGEFLISRVIWDYTDADAEGDLFVTVELSSPQPGSRAAGGFEAAVKNGGFRQVNLNTPVKIVHMRRKRSKKQ